MEYAKAHSKLLYGYSLIVAIVSVLLIEFATPYVIDAYYCHWLALAATLILCVSPFGGIKLVTEKNEQPRHTLIPWLCRLFALELSLFFVYLGMTLVFAHWLPLNTTAYPQAMAISLQTFLKQYGLFPWALYALYAAGLGYVSYIKNRDAYFNELLRPVFKTKPTSLLGKILNFQSRSATLITLSVTFAFITLLLASLLTPRSMPLLTGFYGKIMIIAVALILFGFTPPFKKLTKRLLNNKIPLYITTTTTLLLFTIIIWLLNALFGHLGHQPIQVPTIITWLERRNPINLWIIFSVTWWIGWTPIIASHIARLSRGYRIRHIMLTTLILPLLFTLLIIAFPSIPTTINKAPLTISILAIIGFIYLLKVITEKSVLPMMIRSYLPKRDHYKRRDHYFYFRKLFQMALIIIYIYLPAGITITLLVIFTMTFSITLQIPFYLFSALSRLNMKQTP